MVLGAGRGPFVRSALRAANRTQVNVIIYALEKNQHAANSYVLVLVTVKPRTIKEFYKRVV